MTDFQRFKAYCKKIAIIGAIALGIGVVLGVLALLLDFGWLFIVAAIPTLFGIVALPISVWFRVEHKDAFCKCGHQYDFNSEVGYEEIDNYVTSDGTKRYRRIEFECRCGVCGESKTFTKKFVDAQIEKSGKITQKNVKKDIKNLFVFSYK